jgi:hypothetical protein
VAAQEPAASSLFMGSSPHDAAIDTVAALVASEMRAKLVVFIPNRWVLDRHCGNHREAPVFPICSKPVMAREARELAVVEGNRANIRPAGAVG